MMLDFATHPKLKKKKKKIEFAHLEDPFSLSISSNLTLTLNLFQKSAPLALTPLLSRLDLFLGLGENGVINSSSPSLKNAFFSA